MYLLPGAEPQALEPNVEYAANRTSPGGGERGYWTGCEHVSASVRPRYADVLHEIVSRLIFRALMRQTRSLTPPKRPVTTADLTKGYGYVYVSPAPQTGCRNRWGNKPGRPAHPGYREKKGKL
jgi:hypothetical protein